MIEETATIFLLRKTDSAVLLQKRDNKPNLRYPGMWGTPGGHAEIKESMEDCIRRELLEETGYQCSDLYTLTRIEDQFGDLPPYAVTVFWSYYDGIQPLQCCEGEELRFVKKSEAPTYAIPPVILQLWNQVLVREKINHDKKNI